MANLVKKVRSNDFVDQLLIKCKEHKGPKPLLQKIEDVADLKKYSTNITSGTPTGFGYQKEFVQGEQTGSSGGNCCFKD